MQRNGSETLSTADISPEAKLTPDPSKTCRQTICADSRNCIFLQVSEDGQRHCAWHLGPTTDLFGQEAAHVSRSAPRASVQDLTIPGTSGQLGSSLLPSDDLQSSLESNLRKLLTGSDLCEVIWKPWITPWGQCRSRPRARVRTHLATDFGLWPRPTSLSFAGSHQPGNSRNLNKIRDHVLTMLGETSSGVAGQMAKSGALTPALIGWLMGFRAEWLSCADSETPSIRGSAPPSSVQP